MIDVHVRPIISPRTRLWPAVAVAVGALSLAMVTGIAATTSAQEADASPSATPTETSGGIDGTWTVNTELGSFEGDDRFGPYSSSWVGFRVAEVLQQIGESEAVGRTPVVSGELTASGSVIESASIEVDLTTITSDQSRRDPAIQRSLDTTTYPTATFTSSAPVDLGSVPPENEPFSATVPGTLTIRGIDKEVELTIDGQRVGDIVLVVGTLPIDFTEFDVTMPVLGPVISVEDTGSLEWQLFFEHVSEA